MSASMPWAAAPKILMASWQLLRDLLCVSRSDLSLVRTQQERPEPCAYAMVVGGTWAASMRRLLQSCHLSLWTRLSAGDNGSCGAGVWSLLLAFRTLYVGR